MLLNEYNDGRFEIISNSIFIDVFLNCHKGTEQNPGELSERFKKINNEIFQICIFNLTKDVDKLNENELRYFVEFQMQAECFNFDEMYLKEDLEEETEKLISDIKNKQLLKYINRDIPNNIIVDYNKSINESKIYTKLKI